MIKCWFKHSFVYIKGWMICEKCLETRDLRWLEEHSEPFVATKKTGAIYEAPLDIDLARQEIIDQNNAEGRQTKLSDLEDDYE